MLLRKISFSLPTPPTSSSPAEEDKAVCPAPLEVGPGRAGQRNPEGLITDRKAEVTGPPES